MHPEKPKQHNNGLFSQIQVSSENKQPDRKERAPWSCPWADEPLPGVMDAENQGFPVWYI